MPQGVHIQPVQPAQVLAKDLALAQGRGMSDGTTRRPARCDATGFARDEVLRALEVCIARLAPGGRRLEVPVERARDGEVGVVGRQLHTVAEADALAQVQGPDPAIGADRRRLYGEIELWPAERQVKA